MTVVAAVVLLPLCSTALIAQTWDLKSDWSNSSNPNGAWSYWAGLALGTLSTRGSDSFGPPGPPPIWTNASHGNYFGWSQSNGSEAFTTDLQPGDIYGHTDPGVNGELGVRWTSSLTGTVRVSGGTWMLRDIGRSNDWALSLNGGASIVSGRTFSGDPWDRSNPDVFSFDVFVNPGDYIQFSLSNCCDADYNGVNMSVRHDLGVVPEPSTASFVMLGLLALVPVVRRRLRPS